jgi:hypothetical protein
MMKRLTLASLALLLTVELASAQTCRTTAQMRRDQCTRENAGSNERSRQCLDSYLVALDRCESGGYNPVDPPAPRGRVDPLDPPTARSRPVVPQVNPRPAPIQPRIQPRVDPYDRRARP